MNTIAKLQYIFEPQLQNKKGYVVHIFFFWNPYHFACLVWRSMLVLDIVANEIKHDFCWNRRQLLYALEKP